MFTGEKNWRSFDAGLSFESVLETSQVSFSEVEWPSKQLAVESRQFLLIHGKSCFGSLLLIELGTTSKQPA